MRASSPRIVVWNLVPVNVQCTCFLILIIYIFYCQIKHKLVTKIKIIWKSICIKEKVMTD